jgi:hypothetical protein
MFPMQLKFLRGEFVITCFLRGQIFSRREWWMMESAPAVWSKMKPFAMFYGLA